MAMTARREVTPAACRRRALRLGLAAVDIDPSAGAGGRVVGISAVPALGQFERLAGVPVAEPIIAHVETHVRSCVRHSEAVSRIEEA
jgi:hypothetical protein